MRSRTTFLKLRSRVNGLSPPRPSGARPQRRPHGQQDDSRGSESLSPFASCPRLGGVSRLGADHRLLHQFAATESTRQRAKWRATRRRTPQTGSSSARWAITCRVSWLRLQQVVGRQRVQSVARPDGSGWVRSRHRTRGVSAAFPPAARLTQVRPVHVWSWGTPFYLRPELREDPTCQDARSCFSLFSFRHPSAPRRPR